MVHDLQLRAKPVEASSEAVSEGWLPTRCSSSTDESHGRQRRSFAEVRAMVTTKIVASEPPLPVWDQERTSLEAALARAEHLVSVPLVDRRIADTEAFTESTEKQKQIFKQELAQAEKDLIGFRQEAEMQGSGSVVQIDLVSVLGQALASPCRVGSIEGGRTRPISCWDPVSNGSATTGERVPILPMPTLVPAELSAWLEERHSELHNALMQGDGRDDQGMLSWCSPTHVAGRWVSNPGPRLLRRYRPGIDISSDEDGMWTTSVETVHASQSDLGNVGVQHSVDDPFVSTSLGGMSMEPAFTERDPASADHDGQCSSIGICEGVLSTAPAQSPILTWVDDERDRLRPISTLASFFFEFGQFDFGHNFWMLNLGWSPKGWSPEGGAQKGGAQKGGAQKGGAQKGGAPKGGAQKGGGPKFRGFFSSSRHNFLSSFSLLGTFRGGAAGVSHDSPRAQTCIFHGSGLQKHQLNSTKGPQERERGRREKSAKFWAVRRRAVRRRAVHRRAFTGGRFTGGRSGGGLSSGGGFTGGGPTEGSIGIGVQVRGFGFSSGFRGRKQK